MKIFAAGHLATNNHHQSWFSDKSLSCPLA